jgi:hypothetical protein
VSSKYIEDASTLPVVWKKSELSGNGSDCIEIASSPDGSAVFIRDSKNPTGPALCFTRSEWVAGRDGVKSGEFDKI